MGGRKGGHDRSGRSLRRNGTAHRPSRSGSTMRRERADSNFAIDGGSVVETTSDPVQADGSRLRHYAAAGRLLELLALLKDLAEDERVEVINSTGQGGETALQRASAKGHRKVVDALLNNGAQVNQTDEHGRTALIFSVLKGCGHVDVAHTLVAANAYLEATNDKGWTALHMCAAENYLEIAGILINAGANVNHSSVDGWTPVMTALAHHNTELAELLADNGANLKAVNNDGLSVLHLCDSPDLVTRALNAPGARTNLQTFNSGWSPLMTACSKKRGHRRVVELIATHPGTDLNVKKADGNTALHVAAGAGHLDVVTLLLELGANAKTADAKGHTPLTTALETGHLEIALALLPHSDVGARTAENMSALSIAIIKGLKRLVRDLVGAGAPITSDDLRLAKGSGDLETFLRFARNSDLAAAIREIKMERYLPNLYDSELDRLADCRDLDDKALARVGVAPEHRRKVQRKISRVPVPRRRLSQRIAKRLSRSTTSVSEAA